MGGAGKLSRFCVNRIATHARTPSDAKPIAEAPRSSASCISETSPSPFQEDAKNDGHGEVKKSPKLADNKGCSSRKIMVVVDSTPESKRALLWALSHTVQDHDLILLLHVARISTPTESKVLEKSDCNQKTKEQSVDEKNFQVLNSLKTLSKSRRPEVDVEVVVVEGKEKEKGPTIVSQAKKQGASLLVLGQKKPSLLWRLLITWAGTRGTDTPGGVVEYCIQNAECMTVAVRRKNRRAGGYLITTRRQKNFWLLA